MTTLFRDTFTGGGGIIAHTPDTPFGSQNWVDFDTASGIALSGGYAARSFVSDYAAAAYTAGYADDSTDYGLADVVDIQFTWRSPASVTPLAGGYTGITLSFWIDTARYDVTIQGQTGSGAWRVVLSSPDFSFATINIVATLDPDTDYLGTITMGASGWTLDMFEQTFASAAYSRAAHSSGLNAFRLQLGEGMAISDITAYDTSAPEPTPTGTVDIDILVPAPVLTMGTGPTFDLQVAAPILQASIVRGALTVIDITVPAPVLDFKMAARIEGVVPAPTLSFEVTTTVLISIDAKVPAPTLAMSATSTGMVAVSISVPAPTLQMHGGAFIAGVVPAPTLQASVTSGATISIDGQVPAPVIECSVSDVGTIRIDALVPAPIAGPYGMIDAAVPAPRLEMHVTAVVTITYEAYAINLSPVGKQQIYPVTRHTAKPFSGMVHWQGNWYGWGPAGLYLIGGDTDYNAAAPSTPSEIAWNWITTVTDFDSSQRKAMRQMTVGGRLGARSSASVSIGRAADFTYRYATAKGERAQNYRIKFGKGLDDRYYTVGLSGTGICDVDTVDLDVEPLSRKV